MSDKGHWTTVYVGCNLIRCFLYCELAYVNFTQMAGVKVQFLHPRRLHQRSGHCWVVRTLLLSVERPHLSPRKVIKHLGSESDFYISHSYSAIGTSKGSGGATLNNSRVGFEHLCLLCGF